MLPILEINGVPLTGLLAKNGLKQSLISRREKTVVTMDGTEWYSGKKKRKIDVTLVEMPLPRWMEVADSLNTSPATIHYIDELYGDATRMFRISGISATTKTVEAGRAYIGSASFTLTEV